MMSHRFYYYNYKSGQGHTYQVCRDYFNKQLTILPRILIDVTDISLKTIIFGSTAFHCLAHVDGEVETARGATEAQCIYTYNWMLSNMTEEKVLEITGPNFFYIYLTASTDIIQKLAVEADRKGYRAIVVTCDDPTYRVRDDFLPLFLEASKHIWKDIERLRKLTTLPIICKGILSPLDAELAIKYGANGIVVSNHGSRLIDTAVPAIECLEDIINVVDGRAEVFVDTGIRTGIDVLKAIVLGARGVLIGRPVLYGLACVGEDGVKRVLDILKRELAYDMACCGITSIDQINKEI